MELVEQHCADPVEPRIVLDHAGEDALGDHLDAGLRRHLGVHPHPIADRLPHPLAQGGSHAGGGGAGGQAAGLEQNQLPLRPRPLEQRQGRARRLPGPRRRDQHGVNTVVQNGPEFGQDFLNGQHCAPRLVPECRAVTASRCAARLYC